MECLCKLLSTIGHLLDAGKKGPMVMDAYFSRMRKVMEAKGLESRHRFMIQVSKGVPRARRVDRSTCGTRAAALYPQSTKRCSAAAPKENVSNY